MITILMAGPTLIQTLLAYIILAIIANATVIKVASNAQVANIAGIGGENLDKTMLTLALT
jgi:hypothetical protein